MCICFKFIRIPYVSMCLCACVCVLSHGSLLILSLGHYYHHFTTSRWTLTWHSWSVPGETVANGDDEAHHSTLSHSSKEVSVYSLFQYMCVCVSGFAVHHKNPLIQFKLCHIRHLHYNFLFLYIFGFFYPSLHFLIFINLD